MSIRRKKVRKKTLTVCAELVVPLKTTKEKTGYYVRNVSGGRTHFVSVWRKSLFVSLSGINTVLFLVCIVCVFFLIL